MPRLVRSDIELLLDYGVDIAGKALDISGSIDEDNTPRWLRGIRLLDRIRPDSPLCIYINSDGGDVYQGLAIVDAIRKCNSTVHAIVNGECMSMAIWILQAADVRSATPNSRLMLHIGQYELGENHHRNNQRWAKQFDVDNGIMEQLLLARIRERHSEFQLTRLRNMLEFDTILQAEQALQLGLIDEIYK